MDIYKVMLEDNMINYLCFEIIQNNKYKSLNLKYINKNTKKFFDNIDFNDEKCFFNDILGTNSNGSDLNFIINETINNKKYFVKKNILNRNINIKFYYEDKNIIHCIIENDNDKIKEDNKNIDFIATLSHELRTPLNLILSCLQVVDLRIDQLRKFRCDKQLNDIFDDFYNKTGDKFDVDRYLNILNQNALRLLRLVNNLIDYNKIDSGKFDYNPKNYDIVSVIENMCMSTAYFIKTKGLNIIFDTNCEEKIVAFDIDSMERIILNLISNAVKFNVPNGTIEVFLECLDDIKIIIKDTGRGIEKEKLGKIFERFEQIKNTNKKENEGSGIGLSLVKSLVEIQGGTINVESELNVGTTFTITMPNYYINSNEYEADGIFELNSKIDNMRLELADIY